MINYYLITKPGIIVGNLITLAAGFFLASKGVLNLWLFVETLLGLSFIMASACIFNNYIDREVDKKMERTKNRALASGAISIRNAMIYATFLGLAGFFCLFYFTNLLTVAVAGLGFFVYVVLYSLWKCHTIYGTAIGSVAGAVPPVVGYCAVSNHLDLGAILLFIMLILWQMPHFFAIAILNLKDYTAAGIPVLPVMKGMEQTKIRMVIYIVGFLIAALMLGIMSKAGPLYLFVTLAFGLVWLVLSIRGFTAKNDSLWGKRMFLHSLWTITAICLVILFDF